MHKEESMPFENMFNIIRNYNTIDLTFVENDKIDEGKVTRFSKSNFEAKCYQLRSVIVAIFVAFCSLNCIHSTEGFYLDGLGWRHRHHSQYKVDQTISTRTWTESTETETSTQGEAELEQFRDLTPQIISSMSYRDIKNELASRGNSMKGTKSQLRRQLRELVIPDFCNANLLEDEDCINTQMNDILNFTEYSDSFNDSLREIDAKVKKGHWKSATRKLKKLTRRHGYEAVPEQTYLQVLEVCMEKHFHGQRARETARKILDLLVEQGYGISEDVGNVCIVNCLHSTNQGHGGIDTALAIMAAMDVVGAPIHLATKEKLIYSLAKEGSIALSVDLLKDQVISCSEAPALSTFATVANSAASSKIEANVENVFDVLIYAKLAGYNVESIAVLEEGRELLANGVVAAEKLGKDAIGFRLLSAAGNAKGTTDESADALVAMFSPAAQRACTLIHKRAISKAVEDAEWKLAVKLLELMLKRRLRPSSVTWKNVVTCCAKEGKSRKATALLLDWVKLSEKGEVDKPPLSVFNSVINVCETCNEQELTLLVLDSMKKTRATDGNVITFNIALKRLAKLGNYQACEAIIVGMLRAGVEPSVVTYTTAIAACVFKDNRQPIVAYEWLRRMRARNVAPNVISYNTALAACLDGQFSSTTLASKIAKEMLLDVDKQLQEFNEDPDIYRNVVPNEQTKELARKVMQQLKNNWKNGEIEKSLARETMRVPFLKLVDFQKSEAAETARIQAAARKINDNQLASIIATEVELEPLAFHRSAEV